MKEASWTDLRHVLQDLGKRPAFTVVVVLSEERVQREQAGGLTWAVVPKPGADHVARSQHRRAEVIGSDECPGVLGDATVDGVRILAADHPPTVHQACLQRVP